MSIKQKLSYTAKLQMHELPKIIFDKIDAVFKSYDEDWITQEELKCSIETIYRNSDYADKNVLAKIIYDINRLL